MKRRTLSLLLVLALLTALAVPAMAAGPEVVASKQTIMVDGKTVDAEAYNIDGYNYFKLRDIAYYLKGTDSGFSVGYDDASRTIALKTGAAYEGEAPAKAAAGRIDCVESDQKVLVNAVGCTPKAYNINGYNFFKLRDLGQLLGFGVEYDAAANAAKIDSGFDRLSFANATVTTISPRLDGKDISVTMYEDVYTAEPNRVSDQMISVYVPEGATRNSPILFYVNNGGWRSDAYADRTQVKGYGTEMQKDFRSGETKEVTVGDYRSDSDTDAIGRALAEKYVIVSCGARSRGDAPTDGEYLGHSPATMTDTKAAIRYLRYNKDLLPAGDVEKIVITGTSGGGALSTVIAASGNSEDYYESLYEIGAAGIEYRDGKYISTIRDDVFAVIGYCPITDFRGADMAYEWTYNDVREKLYEEDLMSYKGADKDTVLKNSETLKAAYPAYLEGLGLKLEDGTAVTAANFKGAIEKLMRAEIEKTIKELGVEQMKKDIAANKYGESDWLKLNDDGSYEYDYDKHLYYVARNTALKISCAFSNVGTGYGEMMNEDNLFGGRTQEYSPFEFLSWELDSVAGNGVGKDDTGLSWEDYLKTEAGAELSKQIRMTSAVDYLVDLDDGDTAPYWYVRHGMADRDTSFAVEASLYYAMLKDGTIKDINFGFAWLKPHSGNYDVQEAYDWLKDIVGEVKGDIDFEYAAKTQISPKLDGKDISVTMYEDVYCMTPNRAADQMISIYVPENAGKDSPLLFCVNNSGWRSDAYADRTQVKSYGTEMQKDFRSGETKEVTVGDYKSGTDTDIIGQALKDGYVIVSCGARSRGDAPTDGEYLGHSPATMTDTKAAIRYLRYNKDLLPAGDVEKIVITGTSGGGALSTVIAASGNSEDYYESLYEIGAAGIEYRDGKYISTIRDDVFAVIGYCPITDFRGADMAYEWTYNDVREKLYEEDLMSYKGADKDTVLKNSETLKAAYPAYLEGLGLKLEDGTAVTAANFKGAIEKLMRAEIEKTIKELGVEQMKKDIAANKYGESDWLKLNDDGSYEYDYDKHLYYVARNTALKISCAFSNVGTGYGEMMNEDNLFGGRTQEYSPFEFLSWELDSVAGNGVGKDDTGLSWEDYLKTEAGAELSKQIRMTSAVDYLVDLDDGDTAPYWYVRHGMADRDTSFAVEASLYYAMLKDGTIKDINFGFAWLKPHSGNYDIQEVFAWLNTIL